MTTGIPVHNYYNWARGEPNHSSKTEECIDFVSGISKWRSQTCHKKKFFICRDYNRC